MKNILVPIGTSPESHETLQYAVDFATQFSSEIYVMEVFSVSANAGTLSNVSGKITENSIERLKEIIEKVDAKDIVIKIATYNGGIVSGVKDIDKELGIDLIIISPKSNDIKEGLFLGNTSGKIVKQTNIPSLIVPKGSVFTPYKTILTAFKSGVLKRNRILVPLIQIKKKFGSVVNLLLVKTPGYTDADLKINTALMDLCSQLTLTENATTYLGVLENFQAQHPDLLCVFRRKRGFFKTLWEKNTISKEEFYSPVPVLVLSVKKD
ncbi:universal stress protein [Cellulophaga sp. E16_2]|uniref:UspA domain-containing protein n=1 Tax=Cellulophaga algicola (strain DSM 14237 / IC166 / ACAM 630) TaxID=688270 RepID=E6X820_CELAD|nr:MULTISPECIES: universal stress protein [Cellulophaga]ADV48618.1 UspA domain-containing protein [Cellulophaga algicola DSM 14237]MBO0591073.1 universal stress protein [Cellulophaga sp. E16_2]